MDNQKFYVKYSENQTVTVETHFIGEQNRRRPLLEIGDLIAAFFPNTPPNELGQYSLYFIDNGVEINYNSCDPLTVLGDHGKLGTNPLIIRSVQLSSNSGSQYNEQSSQMLF
jgi:hypothetical protein